MKTTYPRIEASAPANVRPSSGSKTSNPGQLHRIDFRRRFYNRGLSTAGLLDLLYYETPRLWELCQVGGKWVWIEFYEQPPRRITATLSELGFHWNRKRQLWQHPCGQFRTGSHREPSALALLVRGGAALAARGGRAQGTAARSRARRG